MNLKGLLAGSALLLSTSLLGQNYLNVQGKAGTRKDNLVPQLNVEGYMSQRLFDAFGFAVSHETTAEYASDGTFFKSQNDVGIGFFSNMDSGYVHYGFYVGKHLSNFQEMTTVGFELKIQQGYKNFAFYVNASGHAANMRADEQFRNTQLITQQDLVLNYHRWYLMSQHTQETIGRVQRGNALIRNQVTLGRDITPENERHLHQILFLLSGQFNEPNQYTPDLFGELPRFELRFGLRYTLGNYSKEIIAPL